MVQSSGDLGTWVNSQRSSKRENKLFEERKEWVNSIGFRWAEQFKQSKTVLSRLLWDCLLERPRHIRGFFRLAKHTCVMGKDNKG